MGTIFKKKFKRKDGTTYEGKNYWIKYYHRGTAFTESTGSPVKKEADRQLKLREGSTASNTFKGLQVEKVTFDDLAVDFLSDYKINKKRSLPRAERSVRALSAFFCGYKVPDITSDKINTYKGKRQTEHMQNATINRELSALKRMFNLGAQQTPPKVQSIPHIAMLEENNTRPEFFELAEHENFKAALPDFLRPVLTMAFSTGLRKEEILSIMWPQVDLIEGRITLEAGTTKNKERRVVFITGELYGIVQNLKIERDSKHPKCAYVFSKEGQRIKDFRGPWEKALRVCGYAERYQCRDCRSFTERLQEIDRQDLVCSECGSSFLRLNNQRNMHDNRRSAIRDMVRSGTSESVCMAISGHRTASTFRRYNITNEADLRSAAEKMTNFRQEAKERLERTSDRATTVPQINFESLKETHETA